MRMLALFVSTTTVLAFGLAIGCSTSSQPASAPSCPESGSFTMTLYVGAPFPVAEGSVIDCPSTTSVTVTWASDGSAAVNGESCESERLGGASCDLSVTCPAFGLTADAGSFGSPSAGIGSLAFQWGGTHATVVRAISAGDYCSYCSADYVGPCRVI